MQISIPEPCHEDWDKMPPCQQGRHCAVCKKDVVDMEQLHPVNALQLLVQPKHQVCGRLTTDRLRLLNRVAAIFSEQQPGWKQAAAVLLATAGVALGNDATAQTPMDLVHNLDVHARQHANDGLIHISGTLTDSATAQPLIGATVSIYAEGIFVMGVASNLEGKYQLDLQPKNLQNCTYTICFNLLGYEQAIIQELKPIPGEYGYLLKMHSRKAFLKGGLNTEPVCADVVGKKMSKEIVGAMVTRVEVVQNPISLERAIDFFLGSPSLMNR